MSPLSLSCPLLFLEYAWVKWNAFPLPPLDSPSIHNDRGLAVTDIQQRPQERSRKGAVGMSPPWRSSLGTSSRIVAVR